MGSQYAGTGASLDMAVAYEMGEENDLNTSGEYTEWPLVAGVTINATKQLMRMEPFLNLQRKNKPQAIVFLKDQVLKLFHLQNIQMGKQMI